MKLLQKSSVPLSHNMVVVDPVDNEAAAEFFRGALAHHGFDVDAGAAPMMLALTRMAMVS